MWRKIGTSAGLRFETVPETCERCRLSSLIILDDENGKRVCFGDGHTLSHDVTAGRCDCCPIEVQDVIEREQFYLEAGESLAAIEIDWPATVSDPCEGCDLNIDSCDQFACFPECRPDGKKVVFKITKNQGMGVMK